jgi:hypothetical protein
MWLLLLQLPRQCSLARPEPLFRHVTAQALHRCTMQQQAAGGQL